MKRIILAFSIVLVLGLAAAAIAFQHSTVVETAAACCCCSGDSCPMKKDAADKDKSSCCDKDCCKDSCPMKKGGSAGHESCPMMKDKSKDHATMTDADHKAMMADTKSSCCACCGDKKNA